MLLDVLLVTIVLVCVALVAVILLQRSEGGALGMSGGGPGAFMTARGTGDLLTQTTQVLAGLFFVLCLAMTLLSAHNRQGGSVVDRLKINNVNPASLAPHPAVPPPAGLPAPAPATPGSPFTAPAGQTPASPGLPAPAQ